MNIVHRVSDGMKLGLFFDTLNNNGEILILKINLKSIDSIVKM